MHHIAEHTDKQNQYQSSLLVLVAELIQTDVSCQQIYVAAETRSHLTQCRLQCSGQDAS